jgi:S1-C subfamily serine protease
MNLKTLLVVFIVSIFTYGCCATQKSKVVYLYHDLPSLYKQTVSLRIPHMNKDKGYAVGTGFAVTKKHLVTAGHLCETAKDDLEFHGYLEVVFINNNGELSVHGNIPKIIKIDKKRDLCLLELKGHGITPIPIMKYFRRYAKIGDEVTAIGSPYGAFPTRTSGYISQLNWDGKFIYSAPTAPGNSGGPVINNAGELVGVSIMRDIRYSHISFGVPAHVVKKFLKENKVKIF